MIRRRLNAYLNMIENYISESHFDFDVIANTETWLNCDSNLSIFPTEGDDMYHLTKSNKNSGGVAIYMKCLQT